MGFRKGGLRSIAAALLLIVSTPGLGQETRYLYDPLGRLLAVVDQGEATFYEYDAVGNLISIRRSDVGSDLEINLVHPIAGPAGTQVEIFGVGFRDVADENQVSFNGVSAPVLASDPTHITTQVPIGATSGPITVTTPVGSAVSPDPFRVPSLTISPLHASVVVEKSRQFTATVVDWPDQRGFWSVEGIEGGNEVVGTITPNGLYTAPAEVPVPATVRIRVTSVPFPTLFADADITIGPPVAFVVAGPFDVRVVRSGTGDPGGLALNLTTAGPHTIRVVRPGLGDVGGLSANVTVAAPPYVAVTRPGTGDPTGLPINVIVGAPASVKVVRPGIGEAGGLTPNVTVARPHDIKVQRQ